MQRSRTTVLTAALAVFAACSSDTDAPSATSSDPNPTTSSTTAGQTDTDTGGVDTLESDAGTGGTEAPPLTIDCGTPPAGAVGAAYDHSPTAEGAEGPVNWEATGLPMGMTLDPLSGDFGGAPAEEGTFEVTLSASTMSQLGETTCTIEIGPALSVDLDGIGPCITVDDDLLALVQGGDGSPIGCDTPEGSGDGVLPDGVSVNPDTCLIEGSSTQTYGTWVFITRLTQAGYQIVVPYCYTVTQQEPDAYEITADHSGGTDNHLVPMVGTFAPGEDVALGGGGDPVFEIRGPCGGSSCYYGFSYGIGGSQFGDCGTEPCFGLSPTALLTEASSPVGFSHELFALGDPVDAGYETRPWVLSWDLTYCISDTEAECTGAANIQANGNGRLRFGFIMQPE